MTIPESIRALVATGPNGHLTTLNADGSPQVTVVWVGIDGDEFVIGHMGVWQKVKNIRRDPRVVLSLLGPGKNLMGLQEYLVIHGKARITEGGAADLLQRLAYIYLGPHVEFPPAPLRNNPGYHADHPNPIHGGRPVESRPALAILGVTGRTAMRVLVRRHPSPTFSDRSSSPRALG